MITEEQYCKNKPIENNMQSELKTNNMHLNLCYKMQNSDPNAVAK